MAIGTFYWAVIGDANPEPVCVVEENGKRVAYTCGCQDSFDVDGEDTRIKLVDWKSSVASLLKDDPTPMQIPATPREKAEARAARQARIDADERRGVRHNHRRFNP